MRGAAQCLRLASRGHTWRPLALLLRPIALFTPRAPPSGRAAPAWLAPDPIRARTRWIATSCSSSSSAAATPAAAAAAAAAAAGTTHAPGSAPTGAAPGSAPTGAAEQRPGGSSKGGMRMPKIEPVELLRVAQLAAEAGAKVVREALDKPRDIRSKGHLNLVTATDEASEAAVLQVVRSCFPAHAVLGEEGGVSGDPSLGYLWCVDPLDGTTNFAHQFPSFAVSVGVMQAAQPVAGCVIEFAGGPGNWVTRTYAAHLGGGATMNGEKIKPSGVTKLPQALLVTGFGYDHGDAWNVNMELWWQFVGGLPRLKRPQGIRRAGAASVDLCHVACGLAEAYWEYQLKPWDVCAGVLILTEAGGRVSTMTGDKYSPFHRSMLATNNSMLTVLLHHTKKPTETLMTHNRETVDLSPGFIPEGYHAGWVSAEVAQAARDEAARTEKKAKAVVTRAAKEEKKREREKEARKKAKEKAEKVKKAREKRRERLSARGAGGMREEEGEGFSGSEVFSGSEGFSGRRGADVGGQEVHSGKGGERVEKRFKGKYGAKAEARAVRRELRERGPGNPGASWADGGGRGGQGVGGWGEGGGGDKRVLRWDQAGGSGGRSGGRAGAGGKVVGLKTVQERRGVPLQKQRRLEGKGGALGRRA